VLIRPGAHGAVGRDSLGNDERRLKSENERALQADRVTGVKPPKQGDAYSSDKDDQERIGVKGVFDDGYRRRTAFSACR
jgi:hypothetical protein